MAYGVKILNALVIIVVIMVLVRITYAGICRLGQFMLEFAGIGDDMDEESPPSLFRGKILPAVKKGLKNFAALWYEGAKMVPKIWPPW